MESEFTFSNILSELNQFLKTKANVINVSKYSFIEPVGMAILKSMELEGYEVINTGKTKSYMETLFKKEYDKEKNYIPVIQVEHGSIEKHTKEITETIIKSPFYSSLSEDDMKDFEDYLYYMIGEVLNNAMHHSLSPIGAIISGQIYSRLGKVQICVVDRGIGFLSNLRKKYNVSTEIEAIKKALEKEVSSPPSNLYGSQEVSHAGYGLFVLSQILKRTNGSLLIISNNGAVYQKKHGQLEEFTLSEPWKGSIVAFEFYEKDIELPKEIFFKTYIWDNEEDDDEIFI